MAWTKMKTAVAIGAGILFAAGTTTVTVREVSYHRQEGVWSGITPSADNANRVAEDWQQLQKATPAVSIRPTKFSSNMIVAIGGFGKALGIYQPFVSVLSRAYNITPSRIVPLLPTPRGNFDFIVSGKNPPPNALQKKIETQYGLVGRRETRDADVLLLRVRRSGAPGLVPVVMPGGPSTSLWETGHLRRRNAPLKYLVFDIEQYLQIPVVDQTGLAGRYDYDINWDDELKWDSPDHSYFGNPDGFKTALLDQLGLELVPGRQPVEMLVVEKANP
jgi:uncharacterized protein (TIGR03435 family)